MGVTSCPFQLLIKSRSWLAQLVGCGMPLRYPTRACNKTRDLRKKKGNFRLIRSWGFFSIIFQNDNDSHTIIQPTQPSYVLTCCRYIGVVFLHARACICLCMGELGVWMDMASPPPASSVSEWMRGQRSIVTKASNTQAPPPPDPNSSASTSFEYRG